jgi:hypothetical protein
VFTICITGCSKKSIWNSAPFSHSSRKIPNICVNSFHPQYTSLCHNNQISKYNVRRSD